MREALAAEYEIIEELGRGGMAMVYRARDRQLEREVAIKVLPFSLAFDAEFVERFQREARTAAQLEHPNIIPIYRVGRSGRVIYFVMKFLRGGSLSTVLAERKKLTPPEIRRLLLEAGSALGYAAQRGIVHRDIKPDNIMFDEFGQCVLTDFGIAKAASGQKLTGTGMSIGTPHYMSPEQARAQAIDGRSDIYSLGVVAYQCLTGTVPYDGEDSFSIGYKHITEPIPTPPLVTADERRIFEVIKRMLMKDPADRFQSCEELVASLQGQPIAAPGAVRASAAAVAVGGRSGAPTAPSPVGGLPPIVSQPTTPLDSPLVNRRVTPLRAARRCPRRVADRSVAMRARRGSWAWLWLVLAVLGGGGGAFYYYKAHGFAPGVAGAPDSRGGRHGHDAPRHHRGPHARDPDSASKPSPAGGDARARADTQHAAGSRAEAADSAATAGLRQRPGRGRRRQRRHPAHRPAARLDGHDRRAAGDRAGHSAAARVRMRVGVSAPRFNFYSDTVVVRPGEIARADARSSRRSARPGAAPARRAPRGSRWSTLRAGPGLQRRWLVLRRAAEAGQPAVRAGARRRTDAPRPSLLWVKVRPKGERWTSAAPAVERHGLRARGARTSSGP